MGQIKALRCDFAGGECGRDATAKIGAVRSADGVTLETRAVCDGCKPLLRQVMTTGGGIRLEEQPVIPATEWIRTKGSEASISRIGGILWRSADGRFAIWARRYRHGARGRRSYGTEYSAVDQWTPSDGRGVTDIPQGFADRNPEKLKAICERWAVEHPSTPKLQAAALARAGKLYAVPLPAPAAWLATEGAARLARASVGP